MKQTQKFVALSSLYARGCVWGCVESCWRPYSAGVLQSVCVYVTRFKTYKIAYPPQDKNLEGGGGLKQITICRKVLLQVFVKTKKFCIAFY
jgi:hypothetical protein